MNTQTSTRSAIRRLELWPVASLAHLPAVVGERSHGALRVESTADDGVAHFASDFCTFVARLTAELETLRDGLAEVRTHLYQARQAPSLRERALEARLDEVTAQLQTLRGEMARAVVRPTERPGMRRVAAVAVGTGLVLAAFSD